MMPSVVCAPVVLFCAPWDVGRGCGVRSASRWLLSGHLTAPHCRHSTAASALLLPPSLTVTVSHKPTTVFQQLPPSVARFIISSRVV